MAAAKKGGNNAYHMAALAVSVKLDAFVKVKKAMDDMMAELKSQQNQEYEKREYCMKELDTNEDETKAKKKLAADLDSTITDLTGQIDTLTKAIEMLNLQIVDTQQSIKRAGEDRAAENKEFQTTVNDQRLTVNILNKALARLQQFYEKKQSFIQQEPAENKPGQAVSAPPPKAAAYKHSGGSGGVMALLQAIIADAERLAQEATMDEQESQKEYASFVQDSNASVAAAQNQIVNNTEAKARAETERAEAKASLEDTNNILGSLESENQALHLDCDFTLRNYSINQEARQQEMEAIEQAKAVLSGADFN
jgi:hypothetical protein